VGLNARALVVSVGLPPRCLTDPDLRISASKVQELLTESALQGNVDDFGMRLAERNGLGTLGPLGLLMREQPTIREALNQLSKYAALVHNDGYSLRIEQDGDSVILEPIIDVGGVPTSRQAKELAIGVLYRILRVLLGDSRKPRSVSLMRPVPRKRDVYRRVLDTTIEFGSEFDGIICDVAMMETQIARTDPAMARYVKAYVDSIASRRSITASSKVRELLQAMIPSGRCSAAEVAQELGIDRRTLHRYLVSEDETFSRILTATRKEMTQRFLEDSDRSLTAVAELVGFSAVSVFLRWFRTNFGCTATEWRAQRNTAARS
jgi:AraC-like DNA-binding protein